ncbi:MULTISPECIES: hypothetical protein [unclassified Bradyrhizobium]|uniref:hypothetical protein n=1 Tax=unclassified Bradyrhizobium TaxID=2631580 RepID=UPI001FF8BC03|nr:MULTISPECIES: hypothetical protein [unclassified Bradyrhizobium]MCK1713953.1 hypothetical protein [Bradyrhizobium sp. 143]MCK1726156.1 hypothetical protein [Bradyrhizobium sp. 142]
MSPSYRFGAFVEEGTYCTDPGAYVAAIVTPRACEALSFARRAQRACRDEWW